MRGLIMTLMLGLLSGCQQLPAPAAPGVPAALDAALNADLEPWLGEISRLMAFSEEQAEAELQQTFTSAAQQPERLFRYALLNQQLKDRLGWIRARDSLQQLSAHADLSMPLLALVRLLEFHNQAMINADSRQTRLLNALQEEQQQRQRLAAELLLSQQQVVELSQKIEALTNLERSMSIRRALTTDTPKEAVND